MTVMTKIVPSATAARPQRQSPSVRRSRPLVDVDVEVALDAVLDDPRALFRLKLLRSTRRLLAERGLDVSMDDIAEAAGVNRRTLFRHVQSRDALVAETLTSAMDWYDTQIERVVPVDRPLQGWITDLATQLMEIHRAAGRGLWQLAATPDDDLAPELVVVNRRRRADRKASVAVSADSIWQRGGGTGPCPVVIVDAVAVCFSSFMTRSMVEDFGRPVGPLAESVGTMLATLVEVLVAAQVAAKKGDRGGAPAPRSRQAPTRSTWGSAPVR